MSDDNKPEPADYAYVTRELGPPLTASDEELAHRYRLAQAHKLLRVFEQDAEEQGQE